MADLDIIQQKPVAMAELKVTLDRVKKEKGELNFRAEKVHTYLNSFVEKVDIKELREKLEGLWLTKFRDRHIVKIIDVMPEDTESLKSLFAGEAISFKQEELKQILDILNG